MHFAAAALISCAGGCRLEVEPPAERLGTADASGASGAAGTDAGEPAGEPGLDAAPGSDGTPDPQPDAAPLASCDELYGDAPGYLLCAEDEQTCSFAATTDGGNCNEMCSSLGGTCVDAIDNAEPDLCADNGKPDDCTTNRQTEICVCTRY